MNQSKEDLIMICVKDEQVVEPDDLCRFCNCDKACGLCHASRIIHKSVFKQERKTNEPRTD